MNHVVYLTAHEYAELMRVDIQTLYRNLAADRIPGALRVGGLWRIPCPEPPEIPTRETRTTPERGNT